MLLQGSAVLSSFGALIPSKWVKGHRSDLSAIGLMAAATVPMLRNAQPPYLNDAVGALRAGSSFAAVGNMCVMATLGWREGYAYVTGGNAAAASGGSAKGEVPVASHSRIRAAASRLSILARAAGGAGLAVAVAGLGTALAGAHQQSEKRINKFLEKTNDQKAGEFFFTFDLFIYFGFFFPSISPSFHSRPLLKKTRNKKTKTAPYMRLFIHIFALAYASAIASRSSWLRRARMGAVGMLAAAAGFAANDVEAFYSPGGWRKSNVFVFAGLLLLAIGEVGAMLGLGFARDAVATAEAIGEEEDETVVPTGAFVAAPVAGKV